MSKEKTWFINDIISSSLFDLLMENEQATSLHDNNIERHDGAQKNIMLKKKLTYK